MHASAGSNDLKSTNETHYTFLLPVPTETPIVQTKSKLEKRETTIKSEFAPFFRGHEFIHRAKLIKLAHDVCHFADRSRSMED